MPKSEVIYDPEQHGRLLTPEATKAHLLKEHAVKVSIQHLADMRSIGGGPGFIKPTQREVRYPTAMLDEWAAARNRKPILDFIPLKPTRSLSTAAIMKIQEAERERIASAEAERASRHVQTDAKTPAE